jgi:hypothetical protein
MNRVFNDLQTRLDRPYRVAYLATKSNIKVARQLLERFFRDAEGRTNRQLDVYFTLQDMELTRDKSDPALEYLTSRGLINTFGPDIAYLTDKGAQSIIEDLDIGALPKELRDFAKQPPPRQPSVQEPVEDEAPKTKRPPKPQVTHIDPDGKEYVLPLGRVCTIGRSPGNDIQVNDQRASKRHAEIRWENFRYVMVDLGSANGTLLNGEYTDQAVLEHDDELVIGRTMLIFQCPEGKLAEPPEKAPEEENITDDVGTEVARAHGRTERPAPVPAVEPMPPPSMPPPSMPPPSMQQVKVVKGRPDAAPPPRAPSRGNDFQSQRVVPRPEPEEPSGDLFGEDPTPHPNQLFERSSQTTGESGDLFGDSRGNDAHADLFEEEATPPSARRRADLFAPPSSAMDRGDEATLGSEDRMSLDELAPEMLMHEPERSADLPELEPVEILPNDPLYEPMSPPSARAREPIADERTVAEPPATMMSPDYEPSDPEIPAFTDWDGVTNDDVLLANQPVIAEVEIPEIEEIHPPKKDEDAATLMVSRNDLFAQGSPAKDDLVRWGDDRPILESHPEFAVSEKQLEGEAMPVASHSIVNLRVASTPGRDPAEAARANAFHRTLAAIRERAERADLPDRDELLGAIDLLEHHAYVRVALAMIDREDR